MLERERVAVYLASRSLARGSRTGLLLNVAIISLVFTNMILLPSIISGSVELFNEQTIDYQTSDIQVRPSEGEQYIGRVGTLLETINRVPGVRRASARHAIGATLLARNRSVSVPITALNPRDEVEVTRIHERMKDGEFFSGGERGEILVGQYVAGNEDTRRDLFASLGGVRVGERCTVAFANGVTREYVIKGIYETRSYLADYTALVTWEELESVIGGPVDQATEVLVRTDRAHDPAVVKRGLLEAGVQEEVKTWREAITSTVEDSIETFGIINGISMLVSLVIAVVVIFIVITIKAMNQRRQIAILKAIGIHRGVIIRSYLLQVLVICTLGTIGGLVAVGALEVWFSAHPLVFPDGELVPRFEPAALVENAAWLFLVSLVAGYIPAWRITREKILSAMRAG
ncbi:MAG TPA: FtsX-like permease family protein [Methanoregulaceae archaeon]|nr:FtsX-like permease family protein [Methanoregulaceae archaeon]HQJ88835.1 FtsX-like permease family protein [Methanoregulaceae archaeon]